MSKINTIRLINLNYNHNAIRISDECFRLNGESTLLSLRNGGGKSVLVQMVMAPFVHKHFQNTKDRPFAGYFTTNKPTFILIEWKLGQGAGYVLTGMMIRKNQEISEEKQEELESIHFIAEYKERCEQDIFHLPVVEKTKKDIVLKSFQNCKQLFESYKRSRDVPFFYYDMQNPSQARQYFEKLTEYQIHYKEWENIIRKINLKESGLSDLFTNCKDEKGLVEKWFLDAVENKLNKNKNRMKEFQAIMEKYIGQYRDNQSKIKRRDTILSFHRDAGQITGSGLRYQQISSELDVQKGRIADFIGALRQMMQQEEEHAKAKENQIAEFTEKLRHLEYEKLSRDIHAIAERETYCIQNLEMMQMEWDSLHRLRQEVCYKRNVLLCAKQQESVTECKEERDREQERLLLCQEKNADLEPERSRLGAQLLKYYETLCEKKQTEKNQCEQAIWEMTQEKKKEEGLLEELNELDQKLSEEAGSLLAKIRAYDEIEDRFNREYQESFRRNILGKYEAGALQMKEAEYEKRLREAEQERTKAKAALEDCKGQEKSLQRLLEDGMAEKIHIESKRREADATLLSFEKELAERMQVLPFFGLNPEDQFHIGKILAAAERKRTDADLIRQNLEQEAAALEKEYGKMAQGSLLELSKEFTALLEEAGIHYVYGMEWLKKNCYPVSDPFLPYSIILSRQELARLSSLTEQIYTSFPIPILIREELGMEKNEQKHAVLNCSNLNFYVWFNHDLLDEEKRNLMLAEQSAKIQKLQKSIAQKKQEYTEYIGMQEKIKGQKVTQDAYEAVKEEIARLSQKQDAKEQDLLEKREALEQLEILQKNSEKRRSESEWAILKQTRLLSDFKLFCNAYEQYCEDRRLLEKNRKEKERCHTQQKLKKERRYKLEQKRITQQNHQAILQQELLAAEGKLSCYHPYASLAKNLQEESVLESAKEAERRYEAITSELGAEQKELEWRLQMAEQRYAKACKELNLLGSRYQLSEEAWQATCYDRQEEMHQEMLLEEQDKKIAEKKEQIHKEEIQKALIKQEWETQTARLKQRFSKEEPLAKSEILTIDFESAIKKLEYEKQEAEQEEKEIQKKLQGFESNLAALAEYEEFERTGEAEWECDFASMPALELAKWKGLLIRDYNSYIEQLREARMGLERILNQMLRKEEFTEDFYRKPLESMLQLAKDPSRLLQQLETTLASYQNLMEKLMVDISLVEKEKDKIAELMEDYLKEVHENLGKIDHNSTISIRERAVKMLKIILPDWQENESFYRLRLADYMDDITQRGILLLEENKNMQEYLGTRVTTKGLYDAVVGIGNVQIRLYKVEAQREYPITWAEVAKNSGGEGFLSAFVILAALLYYMRRDEMDLFAERNEGKVLLMDNPFAQTNAAHLLKPLMDMAQKTNTQLICLSGLGGEAIYNCFQNIYVLTLIAANLRGGMQYLKAEHTRGSKEEEMIISQIEVLV